MSKKADMPKEVMEWVLDHVEYYCPMDEEAEEVLDGFVKSMYAENWEEASSNCQQILYFLGDNFFGHIYGTANEKKIFSKYLDAHTLQSPESRMEYPIGYLKGKGEDLEKQIRSKRSKMVRLDNEIDMKRGTGKKEKRIQAGMISFLLGLLLFNIFILSAQNKWEVFYVSVVLVFAGYFIWRVNDLGKRFLKKRNRYYQEMIGNKMALRVSEIEQGQENVVLNRVLPEDFYEKIKKNEERVNFKRIQGNVGSLGRNVVQWIFRPSGVVLLLVVTALFVLFLRPIGITPRQRMFVNSVSKKRVWENVIASGEKMKEPVMLAEKAGAGERADGEAEERFAKEGVIFSDSNERELRMEEIEALKQRTDMSYQEALGYARNEIYARMGYCFDSEGGKYTEHYSQYEWYRGTKKRIVTEDMFNKYERANIDLILKAEKELREQE